MYKRKQKGWLKHLDFIILDLLTLACSYILAYALRMGNLSGFFTSQLYINTGIILLVFDLLVILLFNTMHDVMKRGAMKELLIVLEEDIILFGLVSIYLFSVKDSESFSRITLWLTIGLHIVISYGVFLFWKRFITKHHTAVTRRAILLVADRDVVIETIERFKADPSGEYNVTGIVLADKDNDDTSNTSVSILDIPVVCSLSDAPEYICREYIDEVYINTSNPPLELIDRCNEMGVTIHRELHTAGSDKQFVEKISGVYALTSAMSAPTLAEMFVKRTLDIIGGLVGSLITLIVMVIVGPKIKKVSPGPILFKQERIGKNGKHFMMYKIRTMHMDAEERKKELMAQNRVADGMMFKLDFDPRIIGNEILPDGTHKTGIGEFLRHSSIDEFPQFYNVLIGQMSLVGTRPPTLDEWEKYEYHHRKRLSIKPGLTGMWQVSGRSEITDFEEVVKLDTEYINNWSLGMDIKILMKTIVKVIKRDGAM